MERPLLLITNDDGIHADGIKHIWQAVHEFADVAIVAPHTEKSGSGLASTWDKPLYIREVPWEKEISAWSVNGTPADCIKMALSVLLKKPPTLIISGVNRGSNAGKTVLYSGTVGGVIEGVFHGVPGIAFSFSGPDFPPLGCVKQYISTLVQHFLSEPLPQGTLLNVTFPLQCEEGIKGMRMAKQGRSRWVEHPEKRIHPDGVPYYWLGGKWLSCEEEVDSDVCLLQEGYLTIVPIQIEELTNTTVFLEKKEIIEKMFSGDRTINLLPSS